MDHLKNRIDNYLIKAFFEGIAGLLQRKITNYKEKKT